MRARRIVIPIILGFILAAASASQPTPPGGGAVQPVLEFGQDIVAVSGATAGGSVVLFSVAREPAGHTARVVRRADLLVDQDQDGKVELALTSPVATMSVWAAVDLVTGVYAVATPSEAGFALRVVTLPPGRLVADVRAPGGLRLIDERAGLEILLMRPGVGAWRLRAVEGGLGDGDETPDGVLDVDFRGFEPIGEAAPPWSGFWPMDLLIGIDPRYLKVFLVGLKSVLPSP